jgi:ATP-dependent Clp protease adaptor protein ClpS
MSDNEGITLLEPVVTTKPKRDDKVKKLPPYHVILHNDDDHSFEYVIAMLQQLFGHPPERGYQMAWEVHTRGRVIVDTTRVDVGHDRAGGVRPSGGAIPCRSCRLSCLRVP